jgi:hypothetical protein
MAQYATTVSSKSVSDLVSPDACFRSQRGVNRTRTNVYCERAKASVRAVKENHWPSRRKVNFSQDARLLRLQPVSTTFAYQYQGRINRGLKPSSGDENNNKTLWNLPKNTGRNVIS